MRQALKLQRWVDLISALLARTHGCTLVELTEQVPGYRSASKPTRRRMFERDKDELRRLGVPIETHGTEGATDTRYTVAPTRFYLPYLSVVSPRGRRAVRRVDRYGYRALGDCEFTDHDLALLADAAERVMAFGDPILSNDARHALSRLRLDFVENELTPTPGISLQLATPHATSQILTEIGDALLRRKQVSFTYYGIERNETEHRTVLPYGLTFTSGHWYLHALDPSRGAVRRFRISRIQGLEVNPRSAGSEDYSIPSSFSVADRAKPVPSWQLGDGASVLVQIRLNRSSGLTRRARQLGKATPQDPNILEFEVRRRDPFLRWILSLAGDATVLSPPNLRREYGALIHRTRAAAQQATA